MPTLTIDVALFSVFLAINLIVGLKYRGKTQTFREYAIGDKKFSTATLTATIVATCMSGSVLFVDLEETYSRGLYYIIAVVIGVTGGLLITGRVIGPRMGKFLNNVSVPEALGNLYGRHVQAIAGNQRNVFEHRLYSYPAQGNLQNLDDPSQLRGALGDHYLCGHHYPLLGLWWG